MSSEGIEKMDLNNALSAIDKKISRLNDQKITALFESLGLLEREDTPKDYLNWEKILIVVPSRGILEEIKKYKYSILRISFVINTNSDRIRIYDFNEWKNSTRNKTQFQIRELLRSNFGGAPKTAENRDWVKLMKKKDGD